MPITTTTETELFERAGAALHRYVDLAERVDPGVRLRHSEWTAHDVTAHLVTVAHRYTRRDFAQPEGLFSADDLAAANADALTTVVREDRSTLLEQLTREAAAWEQVPLPLDQLFPFHGGQQVDGASARCNWIAELLVHGWDVARAAGIRWPIETRDALLILCRR